MSPREIVYIDGFNLYYGAVKNTPYKWLNVERYFTLLRQNDEIRKIHYFHHQGRPPPKRRPGHLLTSVVNAAPDKHSRRAVQDEGNRLRREILYFPGKTEIQRFRGKAHGREYCAPDPP